MDCARIGALISLISSTPFLAACGKYGPPLAPLRLVPVAATDLSALSSEQQVELRFGLPNANLNGPGKIDLDHVEIYAITIPAGAPPPPNRELLTKTYVVGTMAVKPPPVDGEEPAPNAPPDTRPAPGDRVTFVEELTEAKRKPVKLAIPATPAAAAATPAGGTPATAPGETPTTVAGAVPAAGAATAPPTPPTAPTPPPVVTPAPATPVSGVPPATPPAQAPATGAAAAQVPAGQPAATAQTPAGTPAAAAPPPAPIGLPYPARVYSIRGVSKAGRFGQASQRVVVPLVAPAGSPTAVVAQMPTEKGIVVEWTPPVVEPGSTAVAFNVYGGTASTALNPAPLTDVKYEIGTVEYGKEACFTVRSIQTIQSVTIESNASAPACLTPIDKFPPAAPKGLRAVAEDGAVSLVWDNNTETDLAGYLVLRGEVEGGPLPPITPQPIKDAVYRDTTAKAGVRYFYAVVAVDAAAPRNTSAQSAQEAVTAR